MPAERIKAKAAAHMLGISARKVYDLAATGELPAYRIGRAVRFDPADVEGYRASRPPVPQPAPPLKPRVLREHERLRLRALAVGCDILPPLTPEQQAIADRRVRCMRMPPWADGKAIRALYAEARRLSAETGVPHHVDHDIPLVGDFVSGLHVETNMRVMVAGDNVRKGNRFGPC